MKHIPDGADFFSPEHASMHRDFGFHHSAGHAAPPFASDKATRGGKHEAEPKEMGHGDYARGGHVHMHPHGGHVMHEERLAGGGKVCHYSHGGYSVHHKEGSVTHHGADGKEMPVGSKGAEYSTGGHVHPHGHRVVHVEHHPDGAVIHHHAHGGMTMIHPDGRMQHMDKDGGPAMAMPHFGVEKMHDSSEYAHRARGGHMDAAEDKAMIQKAFRQHETAEHGGHHVPLHLAHGGFPQRSPALPRDMKPMAGRHRSPIGNGRSNAAPRDATHTTSPRNAMPGGEMAYGVEPSAEPDMAGSEQGIPQFRRGGMVYQD